ncbi:MAG: cbb3-type cytochrome c oxidase subunit I [Acidimicrobiales bacterium]
MAMTEASPATEPVPTPREEEPVPTPSLGGGAAGNDHKAVGTGFLVLALVFLLAGGVLALLLRAQLTTPDADLFNPRQYRQLFTYHGSILVFLFLLPAWIGLATAIVPLQIGASRLAFPRLQTLALWLAVVGGGLMVASPFVQGGRRVVSGWSLSAPLPEGRAFRGDGVEYLLLGLVIVLGAAILAAANLITTIVKLRTEGMTLGRVPLFSWSVLVSGSVLLLALPVLLGGFLMLFVDHHYGGRLFNGLTSARGGNPLAWPRLFWFGAYPMLWALVLPALGLVSEIVPVFARRRIADRRRAMAALTAVGILAFAGWGSEVRNLKDARPLFVLGALVVLAPVASLFLNWLATLRTAAKERRPEDVRGDVTTNPMLLVLGLLSVLAAGLGAGAVSALGATTRFHANYWAVGQQHLLYFAPATLGIVAAVHYWAPKLWGRHLSNPLGKLELLALVGGAHLSFIPALVLGLQDMLIHTDTYSARDDWQLANVAMTAGSVMLVGGVLLFALNFLVSVVLRRGRQAEDDPWGGHTLEWSTTSPPPPHNFDRLPEVRSETPGLDLRETTAVT